MTYPKTLLFFVIPALLVMGVAAGVRGRLDRRFWIALAVLIALVYVATSPWDNLAVKWGIWHFDWAKTSGVRFAYLPFEEYAFFGLQSVLAAFVWALLARRRS